MIVVLKPNVSQTHIEHLVEELTNMNVAVDRSDGVDHTVLGLVGDTSTIDQDVLALNDIVHKVIRVQEPYKRVNRVFKPQDTQFTVCGHVIGGNEFTVIAGPCAVEDEQQMLSAAHSVKASGAQFLRGGAYKPRSSPYAFQGLGREGLRLLKMAGKAAGLGIVSELTSLEQLDDFVREVDIIQVGARNMQNFALLKKVGGVPKPILLKRGLSATMEEWLMSAEYLAANGNERIILCERGIRTFEKYTRNTLDISAIPMVRHLSHLPILVDPSHSAGLWWMAPALAKAAVVAGANGIIIEVHPDPSKALCDGGQSLKPERFDKLMHEIDILARVEGRTLRAEPANDTAHCETWEEAACKNC